MSDSAKAREAIYQHFALEWMDSTALTLEGEDFDPSQLAQDASWVRFSVRSLFSEQQTLGSAGNRRFRREGMAVAQIFFPTNEGMENGGDLADKARGIFEGRTIETPEVRIVFQGVQIAELGKDPNQPYNQINVEADFVHYETL